MDATTTRRFEVHLPAATAQEREAVLEHLVAAAEALPELNVILSSAEGERIAEQLQYRSGSVSHWEMFRVAIAMVETLFDDDVTFSPEFHAGLVLMLQLPSVPEAMSTQIAFGRRMGEATMRKFEQLTVASEALGRSIDDHVEILASRGEIPNDLPVRCFRGEAREIPDEARMRHAIEVLRRTAALSPEPFRPAVLCVVAWMLWALGKRVLATAYLRAAIEIDPQHLPSTGLAAHIRTHQPEWIVR